LGVLYAAQPIVLFQLDRISGRQLLFRNQFRDTVNDESESKNVILIVCERTIRNFRATLNGALIVVGDLEAIQVRESEFVAKLRSELLETES